MVHLLLLQVTAILVAAFFVLFAASNAHGLLRIFGQVLGIWLILTAIFHVVGYFVPGLMSVEPQYMHERMMGDHWMHH